MPEWVVLLFASVWASDNPIDLARNTKAHGFHIDIIDRPDSLKPEIISHLKEFGKSIQVHLMGGPEMLPEILHHRPDIVFVHPKWCDPSLIRGTKVGVVWDDDSSTDHFPQADEVLFMTVHPGSCGQPMIRSRIPEIRRIMPNKPCWIDGGVNRHTIQLLQNLPIAGIIAGNALPDLEKLTFS